MKNIKRVIKSKLLSTATKFGQDEKGNFAIMGAVTMAMLVAGLALSVDVSSGYFAKQRLQDTTDAIALLAARGEIEGQANLTAAAQEYFSITYPGQSGSRIELKSITRNGDAVTVVASNVQETYFTGIFGTSGLDVTAASTAQYSNRNVDIAMVLDTTFSMNGAKLNSLKSAANNLIDTFSGFNNENLRVSVIPFAQYVNVGVSRRNAIWLDVPADKNITFTRREVVSRSNCRMVTRNGSRDGVPTRRQVRQCDKVLGAPVNVTRRATWEGCVGSRQTPYNERADYAGRTIPGLLNSDAKCGTEIRPLTANLNAAKQTITALKADGNTYLPAGLAWGWRALDNQEPLTEASTLPVDKTDKVMILMTDGENHNSKNGLLHNGRNRVNADQTTRSMCERIKNEDIQVYTIAYEVSDTPTQNMLRRCASGSGNFFNASNAQELNKAFQAIGASLNELRITS